MSLQVEEIKSHLKELHRKVDRVLANYISAPNTEYMDKTLDDLLEQISDMQMFLHYLETQKELV